MVVMINTDSFAENQFSSQDELYVLGDAVDQGIRSHKSITGFDAPARMLIYILGNHDLEMYSVSE